LSSPDSALARAALDAALALVPDLAEHAVIPGSLPPLIGREDVRSLLAQAVAADPAYAPAHAALGNMLLRSGNARAALGAYGCAVAAARTDAVYHLAFGELLHFHGEPAEAAFTSAFALQRIFPPAVVAPGALRVLVPMLPGPWPRNVPLDFLLDRTRFAVTRWYITAEASVDLAHLPPHDCVFSALSADADGASAAAFVAQAFATVRNDPRRLAGTSRPLLARTLAHVAGCVVPQTVRVSAAELRGGLPLEVPVLVRPLDAHGGRGLERLEQPQELGAYLERTPARAYDVSRFVNFHDADGRYRKYRVMFVGGVPYPYHVAIGAGWMLHAYRTEIAADADLRAEDARFLADPRSVFADWDETMPAIAQAIGLDYAGIDCARLPDGRVLVFEADPAMLVHRDMRATFAYRGPAIEAIADALAHLLVQPFRAAE